MMYIYTGFVKYFHISNVFLINVYAFLPRMDQRFLVDGL